MGEFFIGCNLTLPRQFRVNVAVSLQKMLTEIQKNEEEGIEEIESNQSKIEGG